MKNPQEGISSCGYIALGDFDEAAQYIALGKSVPQAFQSVLHSLAHADRQSAVCVFLSAVTRPPAFFAP